MGCVCSILFLLYFNDQEHHVYSDAGFFCMTTPLPLQCKQNAASGVGFVFTPRIMVVILEGMIKTPLASCQSNKRRTPFPLPLRVCAYAPLEFEFEDKDEDANVQVPIGKNKRASCVLFVSGCVLHLSPDKLNRGVMVPFGI
jgi:hypothetical protein